MKKFSLIISVLALVMGLSQCQKRPNAPMMYCGHTQDITFSTNGGNCAKGDFEQVQEGLQYVLKYKWNKESDKDVLHVYAQYGGDQFVTGTYLGTLSLNKVTNGGYDAEFKGTLENVPDEGWLRFVHYGHAVDVSAIGETGVTVDFSEQDGSLATISDKVVAVCDQKIDQGFDFKDCQLNVKFAVANLKFSGFAGNDIEVTGNDYNEITVTSDGKISYSVKTASKMTMENATTKDEYFAVFVPETGKKHSFSDGTYKKTLAKDFAENIFYSDNETGNPYVISPETCNFFSIGADKKIRFTKGNLWCNAAETPVTWNFEANQYDNRCYNGIENDAAVINGELTTTPANTVGALLFYNTSGKPYMYPYVEGSISESEILFTNGQTAETADEPNPDFTVAGETGVYRVLSENEWRHLMERGGHSKFGFANIRISDEYVVNGLVILPDLYAIPEGCSFTSGKESGWNTNQYTTKQWGEMEDAGAVFLPAGGYSTCHKDNPYLLSQYSERGDYMSCNGAIDDGYKYMHFCTQTHEPEAGTQIAAGLLSTTIHGYCGMSIRLVSDVISE